MQAHGFANVASSYHDQGRYDAAQAAIDSARTYLLGRDGGRTEVFLDNMEGTIALSRGYYVLAARLKTRVAAHYGRTGETLRLADVERDLGQVYSSQGEHRKAIEAFGSAREKYEQGNDRMFLGDVLIDLGNEHLLTGQADSAASFLEKGLALARETGYESLIAVALESQGWMRQMQGQPAASLPLLSDAFQRAVKLDDLYRQASLHNQFTRVYTDLGRFDEARTHLRAGEILADSMGTLDLRLDLRESEMRLWERMDRPREALRSSREIGRLKDSLYSIEKARQLAEYEILYALDHKEQRMELQEAEIQLLKKENRVQQQQKALLLGFLFVLILLSVALVLVFRQRIERNRLRHEAREREQVLELEFKERELLSYTLRSHRSGTLSDAQMDHDWKQFRKHFEQVHPSFFAELHRRYPGLSANDHRMLALLKLRLSSKEIAALLNITPDAVKKSRHRLRKKMGAPEELDFMEIIETRT
ncbi:MAG: tetratricopeptide repeat protein [Bacteroidales bacterium]